MFSCKYKRFFFIYIKKNLNNFLVFLCHFFKIEELMKEVRDIEIPAHQYLEVNEGMHIDFFKALKQDPKLDLDITKILPKPNLENPCAQLLEKEVFHEVDELM